MKSLVVVGLIAMSLAGCGSVDEQNMSEITTEQSVNSVDALKAKEQCASYENSWGEQCKTCWVGNKVTSDVCK